MQAAFILSGLRGLNSDLRGFPWEWQARLSSRKPAETLAMPSDLSRMFARYPSDPISWRWVVRVGIMGNQPERSA